MPDNHPLISIILLNWNGKAETLACLHSLYLLTQAPFEIIVVDNGSTDGSLEAIAEQYPQATLLPTGENLGFAEGNNIGIRYALGRGAEWVLLLNNDTEVSPSFLSHLSSYILSHPQASIIGAKPCLFTERDRLDHLGGVWNPSTARFDLIASRLPEKELSSLKLPPLDYACGCSLLIKKELFTAIGFLEPSFFLIWEEADLCYRARKAGISIDLCLDATLWHKVSASFVGGKPHSTYYWWRNRLLWIERNCSRREKWNLHFKIILPEVFQLWKLRIFKTIQIQFTKIFNSSKNQVERQQKLRQYKAALQGVSDYLLGRLGPGPTWK